MKTYLMLIALIGFPAIVFGGGIWMMNRLHKRASQILEKPLNRRWGYNANDIKKYWDSLAKVNALSDENKILKIDLAFPILYGSALYTSLLIAWCTLGSPFNSVWIIFLVGIAVVSDWLENTVQLFLMQKYMIDENIIFNPAIVKIASKATKMKLLFLLISAVLLLVLAFKTVV